MARFINSMQLYMKVEEATANKDEVTPVYVLDEIHALAQPGQDVAGLVDQLIKRLRHTSPVVKARTLRVIKYVVSKHAPEFKRLFGRHAAAVRELTHFRGEQDPFKGDVPNQRVRDLAKETLDVLFAVQEAPSYNQQQNNNGIKGRIQGFGSAAASSEPVGSGGHAGPYGPPGGGGKYVGFGNPRFPTEPPSAQTSATAAATATLEWGKQLLNTAGQAVGLAGKGSASRSMLEDSHYGSNYGGGGHGGGGYGGGGGDYNAPTGPSAPAPRVYGPASGANGASAAPTPRRTAAADGDEEERIVGSICTPGGLRPQPDKADLTSFVENVSVSNGEKVAKLLEQAMDKGPWQATFRALCALEAVLGQGSSASCGKVAVHFQSNPGVVQRCSKSTQASVRIRASAVLRALGVEQSSPSSSSASPAGGASSAQKRTQQAAVSALAPEVSLLDFGDEQPAATVTSADALADLLGDGGSSQQQQPAAAPAAAAANGSDGGMFAGLDLAGGAGGAAAPVANGGDGLFGGLAVAAPGPSPSSASSAGAAALPDSLSNLLGGMDLAGGGGGGGGFSAPPSAAGQSNGSLGDLLGGGAGSMASMGSGYSGMGNGAQQQQPAMVMGSNGAMAAYPMGGMAHGQQMPQMMSMGMSLPPGAVMVMPGGMQQPGTMPMQHPGMVPMQQQHPGMVPMQQQHPGMMSMQQQHPGIMMGGGMMQMGSGSFGGSYGGMGGGATPGGGGGGPIPLATFSTSASTPKISPKQPGADKFDFIGDMLSSNNQR